MITKCTNPIDSFAIVILICITNLRQQIWNQILKPQINVSPINHPYANTPPTWIRFPPLNTLLGISISFCLSISLFLSFFLFPSALLVFLPYFDPHTCHACSTTCFPSRCSFPSIFDCLKSLCLPAFLSHLCSLCAFGGKPLLSLLCLTSTPFSGTPGGYASFLPALFLCCSNH